MSSLKSIVKAHISVIMLSGGLSIIGVRYSYKELGENLAEEDYYDNNDDYGDE